MTEARRSASAKVSGASGLMEVIGGVDAPPSFKGGCSLDSGAVWVSGMMFGWGPDWSWPPSSVSMEVGPPMSPAAEVLPFGAVLTASRTSPCQGEARKAAETVPEGNTSSVENLGGHNPHGNWQWGPGPAEYHSGDPHGSGLERAAPFKGGGSSDLTGGLHQSGGAGHLEGST